MAEVENNQIQEDAQQRQEKPTKQVLIRNSDMLPEQQCTLISISNSAIQQISDVPGLFQTQRYGKISGIIKRQIQNKYGGGWYVIVGKNFGTYVTHEHGTFIHFSFGDIHICIFRAR